MFYCYNGQVLDNEKTVLLFHTAIYNGDSQGVRLC